ncbi:MAG: hypothetical protein ACE37N_12410 [Pseudohongiellaceae bacterium]
MNTGAGKNTDQAHLEPIVIEALASQGLAPAINVWEGESMIALVEGSPRFPRPSVEGLRYLERDGESGQWRTLSRWDEETAVWILVGIELGLARRDMLGTLTSALVPLLVVLPLTIAFYWFVPAYFAALLSKSVDVMRCPARCASSGGAFIKHLFARLANALEV